MIYMPDYPQTKAEAYCLAGAGHSLNGVFEVNEVPRGDAEEHDDEEEKEAGGSDDDEEELASTHVLRLDDSERMIREVRDLGQSFGMHLGAQR